MYWTRRCINLASSQARLSEKTTIQTIPPITITVTITITITITLTITLTITITITITITMTLTITIAITITTIMALKTPPHDNHLQLRHPAHKTRPKETKNHHLILLYLRAREVRRNNQCETHPARTHPPHAHPHKTPIPPIKIIVQGLI